MKTLNINFLSTENIIFTQKLLQEVSENKKLNLSEDQKITFKNVLAEILLNRSNINNLSNIKNQSLVDLYRDYSFFDFFKTELDNNQKFSTAQLQLLYNIGLTDESSNSPFANMFMNNILNSTLNQNKVTDKEYIGDNNAVKARAKSLYQQQIPISSNIESITSRIEEIRTNFFV